VFRWLWQPKEAQLRFRGIVCRPGVPELDALDHPVTAAKVNHSRSAAGIDSVPDRDLFIGAIAVVDHNAIKLDRGAFDSNLDRAEPPVVSAYFDLVVIGVSIHVGLAEIYPACWNAFTFYLKETSISLASPRYTQLP